jgi:hypothetical protein
VEKITRNESVLLAELSKIQITYTKVIKIHKKEIKAKS